jgi:hypothetical protein
MATTTAALTISSSDLVGDALSLSTSKELHKADTTIGVDQTTGYAKVYLTSVQPIDIFPVIQENGSDPAGGFEDKTHWIYVCNKSETPTEFVTITISSQVIGKLYAGDWMWMPWSQSLDTHAGNLHADIELTPSVATGMFVDFAMFHEGIQYPDVDGDNAA